MADSDTLIFNIRGLVQVRQSTPTWIAGTAMAELPVLENAFLHIRDGVIADFGPTDQRPSIPSATHIDATGRYVLPAFVDSHTHLVFATTREEEMVLKIKGASYEEIAARGGGILNSAQKLRLMNEDELFERSMARAMEIVHSGTGAVEIKSGYGLTVKDEVKMLRVARRIGRETPLEVRTTFLGAHAVPKGTTKEDYIRLVIDEMIPAVASERLADYIDVFCEQGFFTPQETERVVRAGTEAGMRPRIHAHQLHRSGGVQVGVKMKALSVDHLEAAGEEEIEILKGSATMPTALPFAAFFLNLPFAPARRMIDAGLPLAVASDYNPGSSPSGNMSMMLSLSCIKMRMTPEEAINATTINTAYAMDLLSSHGSITRGKAGSVVITRPMNSLAMLPYSMGQNLVERVILGGKTV